MKIYIIPVEEKFKPITQPFLYPAHNQDYGVEQDFLKYLEEHAELLTTNPHEADWHYLPIFWTRWHLNHDFGRLGIDELQAEVNKKILDDQKTFLVCVDDDGPGVCVGNSVQFLAARKSIVGIDIPVLCSPHKLPPVPVPKRFRASFAGSMKSHPIREDMRNVMAKHDDVFISAGMKSTEFFVNTLLASYVSLCPRGNGATSFRLFESMDLGIVPLFIGDIDTRPLKKFIPWDKISFYAPDAASAERILYSHTPEEFEKMGAEARAIFHEKLTYQKWCPYVIEELKDTDDLARGRNPNPIVRIKAGKTSPVKAETARVSESGWAIKKMRQTQAWHVASRIKRFLRFVFQFMQFNQLSQAVGRQKGLWRNRRPCFYEDVTREASFDPYHLYYSWATCILAKIKPKKHTDICAHMNFPIVASPFAPIDLYDYRLGLQIPISDESIESLSCMRTVEYLGLGRYGETLDPNGDIRMIKELKRIVSKGGSLIFVTLVGEPMIAFNAHRIYSYDEVLNLFDGFELKEHTMIPKNTAEAGTGISKEGCGCFWFIKK